MHSKTDDYVSEDFGYEARSSPLRTGCGFTSRTSELAVGLHHVLQHS